MKCKNLYLNRNYLVSLVLSFSSFISYGQKSSSNNSLLESSIPSGSEVKMEPSKNPKDVYKEGYSPMKEVNRKDLNIKDVSKKLGINYIEALAASSYYEAYGASLDASGTVIFNSSKAKGQYTPEKRNSLISGTVNINKKNSSFRDIKDDKGLSLFSPPIRSKLYAASKCGVQKYQSIIHRLDGGLYLIMYNCEGECIGLFQKGDKDSQEKISLSDYTLLKPSFCDALWGGKIPLIDKDGI